MKDPYKYGIYEKKWGAQTPKYLKDIPIYAYSLKDAAKQFMEWAMGWMSDASNDGIQRKYEEICEQYANGEYVSTIYCDSTEYGVFMMLGNNDANQVRKGRRPRGSNGK